MKTVIVLKAFDKYKVNETAQLPEETAAFMVTIGAVKYASVVKMETAPPLKVEIGVNKGKQEVKVAKGKPKQTVKGKKK